MLIVECGVNHRAEREYAINAVLGDGLGLSYRLTPSARDDVVIRDENVRRLVIADVLFASTGRSLDSRESPRTPLATCPRDAFPEARLVDDLPVVYGRELGGGGYVTVLPDAIELGLDVFGTAFELLTRLEEAILTERDGHDRVPASATLPVRAGFAHRPLVDEYTEVLWWAISRLWPDLERVRHSFTVRPTHDVDWPFYSRGKTLETLRAAASDVVLRRNRSLGLARVRSLIAIKRRGRRADPCNTFEFLMGESESRGLTSAFYLMGGGKNPEHDPGYPVDDPWLVDMLRAIDARGHEIGIHPSYDTYRDADALRSELGHVQSTLERAGIEQRVTGGRQHYLRFENPTTWRNWESVGLEYDSTVGYPEVAGFRCGTSRPFRVFDVRERRQLSLIEKPLIAMETALLSYQHRTLEATADEFCRLREVCRLFGGVFTFLWHNNRLVGAPAREAYVRVLG